MYTVKIAICERHVHHFTIREICTCVKMLSCRILILSFIKTLSVTSDYHGDIVVGCGDMRQGLNTHIPPRFGERADQNRLWVDSVFIEKRDEYFTKLHFISVRI